MEATLEAVARDSFGKNEARRTRRGGQVPAVLYGGDAKAATPIAVPPKALSKILHSESGQNTLISLKLAGAGDTRVLVKAFQLDPTNPSTAVNLSEVLYRRGEYERARFYIRRVNAVPGLTGAQTLWLAARIEQRLGNQSGVQELGDQLRKRFPESREAASYERRAFNE